MRIRLRFEGPLIVPIAYHALLQKTVYTLFPTEVVQEWRGKHRVRPFTFSRVLGRTQRQPQHTLTFSGPIDWWISLRRQEDVRVLLDRIAVHPVLVLAGQRREIAGIERKSIDSYRQMAAHSISELGVKPRKNLGIRNS